MAEPKFKPGQFISTPFGRMRIKKSKTFPPCDKCVMTCISDCKKFTKMHNLNCIGIIGLNGYLTKF